MQSIYGKETGAAQYNIERNDKSGGLNCHK